MNFSMYRDSVSLSCNIIENERRVGTSHGDSEGPGAYVEQKAG
ncbi:hypothetical protein Rleg10DRAFT_5623 [Rhizobium leguminosarum bv. trifolii WSM2012]|nr:hypothetical protein Rleg10DRAFT_5623 [Rhizobium leguminosarum bv. trifolii WSM2012]